MAYPVDKETFRRVVNQELPTIPGDVLNENDQNLPADFLERLQDTLGYDIKMGEASVKAFFDTVNARFAAIKIPQLITVYQGEPNQRITAGNNESYGTYIDLLSTDVVFFQVYIDWMRYLNTTAGINIQFQRFSTGFSPGNNFKGIESMGGLTTVLNYVLINPTAGNAIYNIFIEAETNEVMIRAVCFTAIKISI